MKCIRNKTIKLTTFFLSLIVLMPLNIAIAQPNSLRAFINPSASPRIVGGESAQSSQFPWQVSLTAAKDIDIPGIGTISKGSHFCGGSLIQDSEEVSWVLTAAHCLVFTDAFGNIEKTLSNDELIIISGTTNLRGAGRFEQTVTDVISHTGYNANTSENDIGLLKLNPLSSTDLSSQRARENRGPVELLSVQESDKATPYTEVTVSGWGATFEGSPSIDTLMFVNVPVVDSDSCNESYNIAGIEIANTMICAGFRSGGRDSCQGDSGGPLVNSTTNTSDARLVGVVSFGIGCARHSFYGVYTRVTAYLGWIAGHIESS